MSIMAQARDAAFNPSSPHSSSGGGDSYKHEGTPDTRLTAFSPDENSARSAKLLKALSLNAPSDSLPVRFHVAAPDGYCGVPAQASAERDPFVSSSVASADDQKHLSPTASAFRPVSVPVVAHGSLRGLPNYANVPMVDYQPPAPQANTKLSTQLHITRYVVLFTSSKAITTVNVQDYLSV